MLKPFVQIGRLITHLFTHSACMHKPNVHILYVFVSHRLTFGMHSTTSCLIRAAQEKKEKAPVAAPVEEAGQSDISKLDIRVGMLSPPAVCRRSSFPTLGCVCSCSAGLITSVERHPEAEKLYVEKVDLGEGKLRTVVSVSTCLRRCYRLTFHREPSLAAD